LYANGRNGITFIDADGGPHYIISNTIHSNAWSGVNVARSHETYLVNNLITGNGTASGSTGGRFGVSRESSTSPNPAGIHLLNNLICGNRLGEINGPALDPTDANNLTPIGTEGSGVLASPGCEITSSVYANLNGADDQANTSDDDFTLATTSPAIDRGIDPRTLGLDPAFNPLLEADYATAAIRPQDGNGDGTASFDLGARELLPPNRPPVANAGPDQIGNAGALVTLTGSSSFDPDGDPITFQWTQLTGPTVSLATPTAATTSFPAPQVSTQTALTFELRVSDGPLTSTASVTITVLPIAPPGNRPPVLTGFSPTAGPVGTTVTLTGADLDTTTQITFGGRVAAFTVTSSSQLIATVPSEATSGPIVVTTPGGTASSPGSFTVTAPPTFTITTPAEGATINADRILVRGTVTATTAEVGVVVNGAPAFVNGTLWAVELPLEPGVVTLTATATDTLGAMASTNISVTVSTAPVPPVTLEGFPVGGPAPLSVAWRVGANITRPLVQFEFDETGNGTFGPPTPTFDGVRTTYTGQGMFAPTLRATDDQGQVYTATTLISVGGAPALEAKWEGMKDALRRGDIPAALTFIHSSTRDRYEATFRRLTPAQLAIIDQFLTGIYPVRIGPNGAEYEVRRIRDGQTYSYAVWFQVDADGIWRIRMF
jgi:hypothetical protein